MSKVRFSRLGSLFHHPCNHPVAIRIEPLSRNNLQNHRHLAGRPQRLKKQRMRTLIPLPTIRLGPGTLSTGRRNH